MPVEIKNFHSALQAELVSLVLQLEEFLAAKKSEVHLPRNSESKCDRVNGGCGETASTDSNAEINMIVEDYLAFATVLTSHSDSEDALIFPVLVARIPDAREKLTSLDAQHNQINSLLNVIKSQLKVYPVVNSEPARMCILEDILSQSVIFKTLLLAHLDTEEKIIHPLMLNHMNTEEVNVIVGRVLGHRSSDMMEKILKLMYRHLSSEDFGLCLDNIQNSVSGTFFEKWLAALPKPVACSHDTETVVSSIFEVGSVVSEEGISFENNSTVAGVMSGTIPEQLREHAIVHLRKDYDDPVQYSLEEVIRQENARQLTKNRRKKRKVNLSDLRASKRHASAADLTSAASCAAAAPVELSATDLKKSYFSESELILGCQHYRKKCKIIAPCCSKVFVCRLCHNEAVDGAHMVDRYNIKTVICMECETQQPVSNTCVNPKCGITFAKYFCKICNFYNDSDEPVYHCPYCNICRKGTGLGLDSEFFHCMTCNACVRNLPGVVHKCLSHSIERTCPICQSYLFDSVDKLKGLGCGHVLHLSCFSEYKKKACTCPICRKHLDGEENQSRDQNPESC